MTPFCPFLPWHTSHRLAKITAPSLAVPRPAGSACPCGPIMRSKLWISSWLSGVPTLNLGVCASPAAGEARIINGTSSLSEHRIVYAPIASHPPGLHHVGVNGTTDRFFHVLFAGAPVLVQLLARGLNFTQFVGGTRQDHRLFSVPRPVERKPGMGPWNHRPVKLRFLPGLAAVSGHIDLLDDAPTGPGQAGN